MRGGWLETWFFAGYACFYTGLKILTNPAFQTSGHYILSKPYDAPSAGIFPSKQVDAEYSYFYSFLRRWHVRWGRFFLEGFDGGLWWLMPCWMP
jgi:hypothetical protein